MTLAGACFGLPPMPLRRAAAAGHDVIFLHTPQ
jgi:hypothetical protein